MIAQFRGGPLDGQKVSLPVPWLTIEISDLADIGQITDLGSIGANPNAPHLLLVQGDGPPRTRYVLGQLDDRKGIAHYYVPTGS